MEDGFDDFGFGGALKGTAAREGLISDDTQGEEIGEGAGRLHLKLLGRHVKEGSLEGGFGMAASLAGNAEIDNLDGVVIHHEDVGGFDIAVDEALLVGGVEAVGGLRDDFEDAGDAKAGAAVLDEAVEGDAGQQGHHEKGFLAPFLVELADVINIDDIGVDHGGEDGPLLIKELEGCGIVDIEDGLESDFALHEGVEGAIDDAHAAAAEDFAELIALLQIGSLYRHDDMILPMA